MDNFDIFGLKEKIKSFGYENMVNIFEDNFYKQKVEWEYFCILL